MPLPVIANTFRVALLWKTGGGLVAVNVIHVRSTTLDPTGIFLALSGTVTQDTWSYVASAAHVDEVHITPLDGVSATQVFLTAGGVQWQGSAGGDFIPASCSIVSLRTGTRGRSFRGRVYLPFLVEGQQQNGVLSAGGLANWQEAWDDMIGDLGATLVVASYKLRVATAVTSALCEGLAATQRRRQSQLR